MSMRQTKGKQTKGKQKIEMKKVEAYGDRMITFSKRKAGIYKKLNEIITMCDVEASFLVFSHAGKPYSFAHPSMEEVSDRLINPLRHELSAKDDSNNTGALVEAYKKRRIEDLMKQYVNLVEQFEMEKERSKILNESGIEKELNKMWWNIPSESYSSTVEELKRSHQAFTELHDSLYDLALLRSGENGASYGRVGCGPYGGHEA